MKGKRFLALTMVKAGTKITYRKKSLKKKYSIYKLCKKEHLKLLFLFIFF